MKTVISKWGNSLAMRIPVAVARQIKAQEGTAVELTVARGRLVISRVRDSYDPDKLIDAITSENRHDETEWGQPGGVEVW